MNKKDKKEYNNKYREAHKDKAKKYYEAHKEGRKIYDNKYKEANKDKINERQKKYCEAHKDEKKDYDKKYREANKDNVCIICGKPAFFRYCSRKCMGIGIEGENHFNWQGGKSFEPYPLNWTERFKRMIRKRDCYLCMMCNRHQEEFNRSHDVHHIDGDKMNTTKENCITLCQRHHSIVEQGGKKYTFWMPKFQKMLSKLYGYNYKKEVK